MTLLYWQFQIVPLRNGVFDRFPLTITARPLINTADVYTSSLNLALGFQANATVAIREYRRFMNYPPASTQEIRTTDVFLSATDLLNHRDLRTPDGVLQLQEITPISIADILAYTQSSEERSVDQMLWTLTISPVSALNIYTAAGDSDGPPKWLKKLLWKRSWYSHSLDAKKINCAAFALAYWFSFY